MQLIVLCFLFCLVVFTLTMNVTSMPTIIGNTDHDGHRSIIAQRLRAPLMGRSISPVTIITTTVHDDANRVDSNGDNSDEELFLGKRRHSFAILGRRRWVTSKKRGPLFG
ncbi:unnamed protein product [Adineta ricciae]|uniref:Uncharacterized protein n=1 Tax=Adineta ricciae TaxID=249248 RepID=A0A813RTI0_ADIRI|nr:unnamed protein product [Adineta ricciae]